MENIKIAINASPRSGHAWLQFLLVRELGHYQQLDIGEGITDNFVIRCSVPTMLYGKFDAIQQVTILRNPLDIIPSIVTKTLGGLGNTVSSGIAMPHEFNNLPDVYQLLNDQFNIYRTWCKGITNNINELSAFTFEDVADNFVFVVEKILNRYNLEKITIKDISKDELIQLAKGRIDVHDKGDYGFNNPVPVNQKPNIYYDIKEIVNNHRRLSEAIDFYEEAKNTIYLKWNNSDA